jgi:hypothetical protein
MRGCKSGLEQRLLCGIVLRQSNCSMESKKLEVNHEASGNRVPSDRCGNSLPLS